MCANSAVEEINVIAEVETPFECFKNFRIPNHNLDEKTLLFLAYNSFVDQITLRAKDFLESFHCKALFLEAKVPNRTFLALDLEQ